MAGKSRRRAAHGSREAASALIRPFFDFPSEVSVIIYGNNRARPIRITAARGLKGGIARCLWHRDRLYVAASLRYRVAFTKQLCFVPSLGSHMKNRRKLKIVRRTKAASKAPRASARRPAAENSEVQIEKLSVSRLQSMLERVDAAIGARETQEKAELRERFRVIAERAGFTLDDVMGEIRVPQRAKAAVKFQNPKDPSETWTGRGRMPRWLAAKLKAGARLDSFRL